MTSVLVVRPGEPPLDLAPLPGLDAVSKLIVLPGAVVTGLGALVGAAGLRDLVLSSSAAAGADLAQLAGCARLRELHLNGMHLRGDDLAPLAGSAVKRLVLHRVTGLRGADVVVLDQLTQLRLSDTVLDGVEALAQLPRLRLLQVADVVLPDLRLLAAKRLVDVEVDQPAADESHLPELLATKPGLKTFGYPARGPEVLAALAGCTGLHQLTLHGGAPGDPLPDLAALSHLPLTSVQVLCAPSQARAEALLERAQEVWPGLEHTGWRQDWD